MASLTEYKKKRKFDKTPEPGPKKKRTRTGRMFVIQKHRATQLHYDFRLEVDGVLKSWAVPKGPSLDPSVKRLAMQVEDHPVDYAKFEGVIPEGEYGGGTVMVWDYGTYKPEGDLTRSRGAGERRLQVHARRREVERSWVLVRTRNRQWLLIKHRDYYTTKKKSPRSRLRRSSRDERLRRLLKMKVVTLRRLLLAIRKKFPAALA